MYSLFRNYSLYCLNCSFKCTPYLINFILHYAISESFARYKIIEMHIKTWNMNFGYFQNVYRCFCLFFIYLSLEEENVFKYTRLNFINVQH